MQYTSYDGDGRVTNVDDWGISSSSALQNLIRQGAQLIHSEDYSGPTEYINQVYVNRNAVSETDLLKIANTSYAGKYDAAGRTTGYTYTKNMRYHNESNSTPEKFTWRFNTSFFDMRTTYQEKQVFGSGTASSGNFTPASTFSTYDVNGNRIAVEERKNGETKVEARPFVYSADGRLRRTVSGFFKDQHFTAPDKYDNSSSQRYTVRAGDTLQSIALLYYGSSDYWYIIASANGLSADIPLQESTTLDIPARASSENSSDSFKPMQLAQIIGDTTPTLPYVPAPSDAGCGAIGTIIMVAVAVALTVVTAGAAAVAMGATTGAWAAGGAALMGSAAGISAGASMAAAAIGGFVGSVGSQLVGKAMGNVDSFSLKGALASGLTAGVTAGAGAALQGAGSVFGQTVMKGDKLNALGRGIQASAAAAGSVAANKLVGNQASFSWRDVATSAVSAYAGTAMFGENPALAGVTNGDIVRDTFGGIAHAAIGYGAGKLIQQSGDRPSWNFSSVATDAFGNALGNSFVASRVKAEEDRLKAVAKPVDPDTGKFSPISETEAWSLERAIQQKNARELAAKPSAPGWINDNLLKYELGNYFAGVDELNFTMDEGLIARVDNALLEASYRQAQQQTGPAMFGGFVESTPDGNPMGLLPESLARANFVVRNPLARFHGGLSYDDLSHYEQQHYKIESEKYLASLEGPQLVPQNPKLVAREQQQKDFLRTGRPQPWHMPVSEGINDGLMLAAFRYHPGKFMAAQAGYSFGNGDQPWLASGMGDFYGADIRLAASLKNDPRKFEAKFYTGTDSDLNFSWKSNRLEFAQNGLKGNVSQHYQLKDILDFNSFQVINIAEFDTYNVKMNAVKLGKHALPTTLTPGIRVNLNTLDVRASFNYKLELPKELRPFGWTPSIGIEVRK